MCVCLPYTCYTNLCSATTTASSVRSLSPAPKPILTSAQDLLKGSLQAKPNSNGNSMRFLLCLLGWAGLGCDVLCCAGFCCALLCSAVLWCAVLWCGTAELCCAVLRCAVMCCAVLCLLACLFACWAPYEGAGWTKFACMLA